jgi:SpoVK/Ycf46/Vps4 family AAA+-type ATPase
MEKQGLIKLLPLLAALITGQPLLLIGPHGTAKTLLLTRIATALGLEFRHYNASLLNFDDLVGFPLPGKDGQLEYIKTPAAVWPPAPLCCPVAFECRARAPRPTSRAHARPRDPSGDTSLVGRTRRRSGGNRYMGVRSG